MPKVNKEKKTIKAWCISCIFAKTEDGKHYRARSKYTPTEGECLDCLYNMVKNIKVIEPSNWRNDVEEEAGELPSIEGVYE